MLSCLRASSVVQALQNNYGVDPKRLTAGGRGEYNPLQPNTTELGKQRNRRTQIIITPKLDEFMDLIGQAPDAGEGAQKLALLGALTLYLDFINLFIYLLRIFGKRE